MDREENRKVKKAKKEKTVIDNVKENEILQS